MVKTLDAHQEGRIALAINALKKGQIKSIRAAARNFDVPCNTLNARYHGRVQKGTTYTKRFRMTQYEEEALVQWIISMGKRGMPPRPSGVQSMANTLIFERGELVSPTSVKAQYGILDEDIYNFDETSFAMGTIAITKVVTSSDCFGKPLLLQLGNCKWVTAIELINACG
ncbi:hypothetical protein B7463_g6207, partial [Scytalidium lignicola]